MFINTARRILQELAFGRNPNTGEPLESDSVLNDVSVARALFFAVQRLDAGPDVPLHESVDPGLWEEYCVLRLHEELEFFGDEEEIDDSFLVSEYDFEEPESERYYQDDDDLESPWREIYEYLENYARSEEDGWFYPDSENG